MSLDTQNSRVDEIGDGIVSEFDYSFRILDKTHLQVTTKNLDGVETLLECDIDYTVAGVGSSTGGSITLLGGALADDWTITIRRVLPIKQPTDIKNQRDFYPHIHEIVFDRITMLLQQIKDEVDRSIKLPVTTNPATFDPTLPTVLGADRTLVLGEDGLSVALGPTPAQLSAAGAAASDALDYANAAASSAATASSASTAAAASAASAAASALAAAESAAEAAGSGAAAIGISDLTSGVSSVLVSFSEELPSAAYTINITFQCSDSNPIFLQAIVTARSSTGFTVKFNAPPDSSNYKMLWSVILIS